MPTIARDGAAASATDVKTGSAGDVDIVVHGAAGCVTLQRPAARNALTDSMRAAIGAAFPRFARDPQVYAVLIRSTVAGAFSVGGDVREIVALRGSDPAEARASLAREYALIWLLECFSKPTVSLIDGMVMGSGVGISQFGTHRVAGPGYRFAMPETALGLFPDDGVASVLARLPDHVGIYLGLTGRQIDRADAFALGLVTHCLPAAELPEVEAGLAAADPVDPLLDDRHVDPGPAALAAHRSLIADCFVPDSVPAIIGRLEAVAARTGPQATFATGVLADLARAAPLSLAVTLRHIREAAALDLRQTLMRDYRLAIRFLEDPDFTEGVRALLIDKDKRPRWRPASLHDVTPAMVDRYFEPRPGEDLNLKTRQEMQAARV